jgi:hypothetical protein
LAGLRGSASTVGRAIRAYTRREDARTLRQALLNLVVAKVNGGEGPDAGLLDRAAGACGPGLSRI